MLNKYSTTGDALYYYYQVGYPDTDKLTTYQIVGISEQSKKFVVECIYDEAGIIKSGELLKVDFGVLAIYPYYRGNPVK